MGLFGSGVGIKVNDFGTLLDGLARPDGVPLGPTGLLAPSEHRQLRRCSFARAIRP
jgi:hypothetical protein